MKFSLFFLVVACLAVAGCADLPGALTIRANPSGSITIGATIEPDK